MEWDEVRAHLAEAGVANVATASADGRPHAAVAFAVPDGDVLWIFTRASSGKARNLAQNPRISLMWRPAMEIYVNGAAELVHDVAEKQRVWSSGLLPYDPASFFGSPDDPEVVLVKVTPTDATVVSSSSDGLARHRWHATGAG